MPHGESSMVHGDFSIPHRDCTMEHGDSSMVQVDSLRGLRIFVVKKSSRKDEEAQRNKGTTMSCRSHHHRHRADFPAGILPYYPSWLLEYHSSSDDVKKNVSAHSLTQGTQEHLCAVFYSPTIEYTMSLTKPSVSR